MAQIDFGDTGAFLSRPAEALLREERRRVRHKLVASGLASLALLALAGWMMSILG